MVYFKRRIVGESEVLLMKKDILTVARNKVYQTANFAMVEAYWKINY